MSEVWSKDIMAAINEATNGYENGSRYFDDLYPEIEDDDDPIFD